MSSPDAGVGTSESISLSSPQVALLDSASTSLAVPSQAPVEGILPPLPAPLKLKSPEFSAGPHSLVFLGKQTSHKFS